MVDVHNLPETVVLELGRVAWGAMNLEDRAKAFCELVLQQSDTQVPIGTHLQKATKALGLCEQSLEIDQAIGWLSNAASVLEVRNQVLHSVPAIRWPGLVENVLVFVPKLDKATGLRAPSIEIPLTVAALSAIAERMAVAIESWHDAILNFDRIRDSQGH